MPKASSEAARRQMRATPQRDTPAETSIRSELHRRGLRFRLHRRLIPGFRRTADIVFPNARIAVFVDGCFWHGCPKHGTLPRSHRAWWRDKIETNWLRDADTDKRLRSTGWRVIRIWEHEDPVQAIRRVETALRTRAERPLLRRRRSRGSSP